MDFKEWKKLKKSMKTKDMLSLDRFERNYPYSAEQYRQRLEREPKQKEKIMDIKNPVKRREAIARNLSLFDVRR